MILLKSMMIREMNKRVSNQGILTIHQYLDLLMFPYNHLKLRNFVKLKGRKWFKEKALKWTKLVMIHKHVVQN